MILARYNSYKPSGIEWLGDVPEQWDVKRVKDIFNLTRGKFTHRPRNDEKMYLNGVFPFIQTGDVARSIKYVNTFNQTLNEKGIKVSRKFKKGTIVMTIAANIGDIAVLGFDAYFPDSLVAFLTKQNTDYFFYLLTITKKELDTVKVTNTQDNLNLERLNGIFKVLPPLSEQIYIATYLDQKTSAIDCKVSLLEQKITHYQQLRKSLINEIVCRGLDKNVKLKYSEVNYIGQIPMHWKVERIKDLFEIGRGRVIGQQELINEGKYPVYSSQTENNGCLGYINTFDFNKILLTWTTDGVNAGTVFKRIGKFNCTNICGTLVSKRNNLSLDYMLYALQESTIHNKRIDTNGAKIMNNEMKVINVPFPPIEEQKKIAAFIYKNTQKIDIIISNITKQISALKELRKTLINDVVTGKLKVTQ